MAEAALVTGTFRVGIRTCTMTIEKPKTGVLTHITAEWDPNLPGQLSKQEMRQYREGRDALVAKLAAQVGGSALLIET
jgi:hypothetical protein